MKQKIILLLLTLICSLTAFSQNEDKYAGVYTPTRRSGDPQGGVKIHILPNHTYAVAYFGGVQVGTWKTLDNYFIMQPDTTNNEQFCVFAKHNDNLTKTSIQFDGFTDTPAIYSFDNDDYSAPMHPVFNPNPNCLSYPSKTDVENGKYKTIQLVSFGNYEWGEYPEDSVTQTVYTFTLDPQFNDFKIVLSKQNMRETSPSIGIYKNGTILISGNDGYKKVENIEEDSEENQKFMASLASMVGKPMKSMSFGETIVSENGNNDWVKTDYPILPYTKKEIKKVLFDKQNLLSASCEEDNNAKEEEAAEIVGD